MFAPIFKPNFENKKYSEKIDVKHVVEKIGATQSRDFKFII